MKGAEEKPALAAMVWAATSQGAHAAWSQHQQQCVSWDGDVEDMAANQLCKNQAAGFVCCGFQMLCGRKLDSHWHLGSSGLFKNDHCEHRPY